jgi:peptidoglycan/LPS O-acetylase OafA/YrhL
MALRVTIRDPAAQLTVEDGNTPKRSPYPSWDPHRFIYRPDVDGLRAVAIISVVAYHAFPRLMPGGFVGVDVFFVISGFLISGILLQALQTSTFSFPGFYANRVRRLFPALLLVLAACFVFGWLFLLPDEYANLGKHMVGAMSYIENFVLRRETGYFDTRSTLKPLMHLWSLGIEEQFYVTYPLFLWIMWRFRRNLFAVVLALAALSFALNVLQIRRDPAGAFFLPQTRCWELAIGCTIACWQLRAQEQSAAFDVRWLSQFAASKSKPGNAVFLRNVCSAVGMLVIVIAVLGIHENDSFPGWLALLPACGAALLIIGGPEAWINRKILATSLAVFVGLISYPLYLWHWPILTFARILHGSEVSVRVRIAGALLSFSLAWVTFRFVESPIRFGRRTWIKPAALVTISVGVAGLGYAAYRDGFIERFPKFVEDLGQLRRVVWSTPECRGIAGLAQIDYCRTANGRPPDVLLIGDSHAAVLYEGMAPAYNKRSLTLMNLGQAGCVPFYDTRTLSSDAHESDCKERVNRMLEFAVRAPTVHTIILSSRGPKYMSGEGFGPVEADAAPKRISWSNAAAGIPQQEMYAQALTHTVSFLTSTGKHLILFIDWPELGFDPRSCLPRPFTLFSSRRPLCAVARDQVDARNRAYRELLFGLPKDFSGLKVFDPMPFLCDSSACYAMKDGHLLYSDDNHVSIAGAAYLAQKYFEELP